MKTAAEVDAGVRARDARVLLGVVWHSLVCVEGAVGAADVPLGVARVRDAVVGIAEARSTTADVVALAFLMRHPSRMHPVIGTGRVERIEAAVRAMELELSREEWFDLWRAATGAPLP